MPEQDLDRNQAATPYKLEKARGRGQVAKSPDVVAAVVFTAAIAFLRAQGARTWLDQFRIDRALVVSAAQADAGSGMLWPLVARMLRETLLLSAPFFGTLLLAAVLGNVLQNGWVLSLDPVKIDWNRLNPAAGFKRFFSFRTLVSAARALLKLALLAAVVYFALRGLAPQFRALSALSPLGSLRALLDDLGSLGLKLALALGFVAILDLVYTRREFARQMRMSRRELRDEIKHRDGDPRIRARVRELRRELLKRAMGLQRTRTADVLVTNPTHVAVALRYVHGEMQAPQLVAKGAGVIAAAMRRIASRHGIPVVQNPPLARALYRELPVDGSVPPAHYAQVARIIVWIFAARDARRGHRARTLRADGGAA